MPRGIMKGNMSEIESSVKIEFVPVISNVEVEAKTAPATLSMSVKDGVATSEQAG